MSKLLQDEIDWIYSNIDLYDSPLHARSVIENIRKRYEIAALNKIIASLQGNK